MPQFELEMNGKTYDVEAPSIEAFQAAHQASSGDFLHPVKPAPGSGWRGVAERVMQYPRIFLGQLSDAGETLGKVSRGEVDAASPEAVGAAATIAQTVGVPSPAAGTGAQIARMARPGYSASPNLPAGIAAAQTAADIGSPLPAGIVSNTPGVQAFTQGFRQVPFVGPAITHRVENTIKAAGKKVGDISEELSGGPVPDRPTVGINTRQALEDVIEGNNSSIDAAYDDLRSNHIDPEGPAPLPRTSAALDAIKAERGKAGLNPSSGLEDVERLVSQDRGFNGLQRARSDIGTDIAANKSNPNPGFRAGDMKRIYAAMSGDMEDVVRANALPGIHPDDAAEALRFANGTAQALIEKNGNLARLLSRGSDEGLVGGIINSARDKTGNLRLLGELRTQMKPEDFEKIAGIALHEVGHNPTTGQFSLNQFASNWNKMSPSAKSVLIADPAHRKALDDIAGLGGFLKDASKYENTSRTGHAVGILGLLEAGKEMLQDPHHAPAILGTLAGGYGIAQILARPASASALRRWLDAARNSPRYGAARSTAAMSVATRNLLHNLPRLAGGDATAAEPQKREPLRVTIHPKVQDRYPSAVQPR